MGNGANRSITHGPVSQEIGTWLMLLSDNSWDGDYAVNTPTHIPEAIQGL